MTENTNVARVERHEIDHAPEPQNTVAPMVQMIERIAMDPSIPLDRLEQMLAMKERMEAKEAEKAFAAAFAEASAEFETVPLKGLGNNSKPYALLKDIINCTRPALSRHGLVLTFNVETQEKTVKVTARLKHRDGHSESTSIVLPTDASGSKNAVQSFGSSQTYGQRYAAQAILGLSLGEDTDDDGKAAGAGDRISPDQFQALRDLMERAEADEGKFLAFFKIDHLGELPVARYGEADAILRKKLGAKKDA